MKFLRPAAPFILSASLAIAPARAAAPEAALDSPQPRVLAADALDRAVEALRENRIDAARRQLEAALAAEPRFPRALHELGRLEALSGRDEAARRLLEKALALAPDFVRARQALAEVHRRAGRRDDAERAFKQALALAPNDLEALRGLAFCRLDAGAHAEALYLLERVVDRPIPDDAVEREIIEDSRARVAALAADDVTGKAPDLDVTPGEDPSWADLHDAPPLPETAVPTEDPAATAALVETASTLFSRREYLAAAAALQKARGLSPKDAAIAYRLGVVHLALQDQAAARRAWQDALALGGPRPLVTRHLALLDRRAPVTRTDRDLRRAWLDGRLADALVLAGREEDPLSTHIEADVLLGFGMIPEAIARFDELLGADPADRLALAGRAEALAMQGDRDAADKARAAFFAPEPDGGWERLFLFRRTTLKQAVRASLLPPKPVVAP